MTAPAGLRERCNTESFRRQVELARRFRNDYDDVVEAHLRFALKTLAAKIAFLDDQITELEARMCDLVGQAAPALAGTFGVGPHVAAQLSTTAGDNPDRLSSEAAFAKLCAACPIPASSGKTTRHRLNPGGDRRANNALHTIVLVRMRYHARPAPASSGVPLKARPAPRSSAASNMVATMLEEGLLLADDPASDAAGLPRLHVDPAPDQHAWTGFPAAGPLTDVSLRLRRCSEYTFQHHSLEPVSGI